MSSIKVTFKQNTLDSKSQSFKKHQENLKSSVEVMGICSPVKCVIGFHIDYNLLCKAAFHFLEIGLRQWDPFLFKTAVAMQFQFPFSLRDCME